ncbi:DUF6470 family protein [Natranaerobius thermophilus]|uniref:Uncharacterized protein n=1 Tax=Natranaerobius thermophilus (strain ATCC BAA-1301 / DSM 18059 / JW/NM-WN-LF) TaxID=457570 RepID=B2A832_NATTJ|nr:DUF6470 family protein [Natranaerobius thermophilus]ACB85800.1 hypothetical protein Nther_2234 [Natranaerobius thermophilus JW/NM-WN-LF]
MGVGLERRLQIDFNFGKLQLQSSPMDSGVDASRREFQMDKQKRQFELSTEDPRVEIDSKHVWEDYGRYDIVSLRAKSAQEGMETAHETIGRISAWGDQLQRIEDGGNPIIEQLEEHIWPEKEINVALVPENPPEINFVEGEVDLDYSPEEVEINLEDIARRVYINSGNLNIDVNPEPRIDFRVE